MAINEVEMYGGLRNESITRLLNILSIVRPVRGTISRILRAGDMVHDKSRDLIKFQPSGLDDD